MNFGNNIEKLGFEKSTWPMVEIENTPVGNIIYRGRPLTPDASLDDPEWYIQMIVIDSSTGAQVIETSSTDGFKYKWTDRQNLRYILK